MSSWAIQSADFIDPLSNVYIIRGGASTFIHAATTEKRFKKKRKERAKEDEEEAEEDDRHFYCINRRESEGVAVARQRHLHTHTRIGSLKKGIYDRT